MSGLSEEARIRILEREIEDAPQEVQDFYVRQIANGSSVAMAHMLSMRQAPVMGCSDRAFNEHHRRKMATMLPRNRDKIIEMAEKAGVNTEGKYYVGGLGRYTDPAAWVSSTDDVVSSAKKKNLSVQLNGSQVHKGSPVDPKPVPLSPSLIQKQRQRYLSQDPKLAEKVRKSPKKSRELNEQIIATHGKRQ